ncbi:MAG: hypothetical protein EXS31_04350 [Pedosphaera sp.]|nr:hypothetical protein [Pedosphaera sp.]
MNPALRDLQQPELFPGHIPEIATFQPGAPTQWLDGGAVVLDENGRAREWDASLQAWWENMGNHVSDHFWTALSKLAAGSPEQVSILAASQGTFAEAVVHLTVAPNHALRIERVRVPDGAVVRLSSVLPQTHDLVSSESQMAVGALSNSMVREIWKRMLHAENQLATLMRRSPGVVFSQRTDFTFRAANDHLEELTGIPNPEWQRHGELFWRLVHDSDVEFLRQQIRASALTEQPVTSTYRIRHAQTGRIAYILEQRQATLSPDGTLLGYEGVWVDVTRQTLAERRLFASAWKETLAVLTLGMAHDFGNMLAGIHALSESFLAQVQPDHPFYEGLGLIKKNALQTSQLVNRMVNLHQGQPGERGYLVHPASVYLDS